MITKCLPQPLPRLRLLQLPRHARADAQAKEEWATRNGWSGLTQSLTRGGSCVDGPRLARDHLACSAEVACSHVSGLWVQSGGLLALMGSANRVLIIQTGSMSR
jgi:hypothetical protein